jgi:hypothetical protein
MNPDPVIAISEILQQNQNRKNSKKFFSKQRRYTTLAKVETKETPGIFIGGSPDYHNMTLCVYQLMEPEGWGCANCECAAVDSFLLCLYDKLNNESTWGFGIATTLLMEVTTTGKKRFIYSHDRSAISCCIADK